MTVIFYHYTSGEERTIEAETEDLAWEILQDQEEEDYEELKEHWYVGYSDATGDEEPYHHDDDEAQDSEECC